MEFWILLVIWICLIYKCIYTVFITHTLRRVLYIYYEHVCENKVFPFYIKEIKLILLVSSVT